MKIFDRGVKQRLYVLIKLSPEISAVNFIKQTKWELAQLDKILINQE